MEVLYAELHRLARSRLAHERPGGTLQATALVHEAWLRLTGGAGQDWSSRAHFFGAAARAMQRILVESARARGRRKRGGEFGRVTLEDHLAIEPGPDLDLLALDEALTELQVRAPRKAEVVSLRYFAGLEFEDVASLLQIAPSTAKADWTYARAWLHRRLSGAAPTPDREDAP